MTSLKKKGLGVLGGSFDPPHKGHIKISLIAIKKLDMKKVYWVVTRKNPLKKKPFFSISERLTKSKNLVKKFKKIRVIFLENKIKSNRTINLIKYLKKLNKEKNLYLLLGSDNLINFHKWTSWKKIVKMIKLVVFSRKGYDKRTNNSVVVKYLKRKNIIFINNKQINISSSSLRKKNENN
tara:strand:- start:128 stop:667 length:540 start_codon:yes stop_codon:yes gene_type:complete